MTPHFKVELFSRGGDPRAPLQRVFELPPPGLPANARVFGVVDSHTPDVTDALARLLRNAVLAIDTLSRRTLNTGIEGTFESILVAINRGYAELAQSGAVPTNRLPDTVVGMVVGDDLFLTARGEVEAWLFRPGEAPQSLFANGETAGDSRVLFRTLVSGSLRPGDILLLAVSPLFEYLSLPHIERVLGSHTPAAARTKILELLGDVPATTSLSGVLVGATEERVTPAPGFKPREAAASREREQEQRARARRSASLPIAQVGRAVAGIGISLGKLLRGLGSAVLKPKETLGALRNSPTGVIQHWNALPKRKRFLFILLIVTALSFGESLRILSWKRGRDGETLRYNEAVAAVQEKRDAAEARLIYKDETGAWEYLHEAETLIGLLPQGNEKERKTAENLRAQIEGEKEKLRHVIKLENLTPLTSLPAEEKDGSALLAGKTLLTLVTTNGTAWNWDRNKKTLTRAFAGTADEEVKRAFVGPRGILIWDGKEVLERVATSTNVSTIETTGNAPVTSLSIWNGRLYALSANANQVFRGSRNGNRWRLTANALTDPAVSNGTDLAIDGSLWVLEPTGVKKYYSGALEAFPMQTLDPAPIRLSRIWTSEAANTLFLYDSELKRLFAVGKDGRLKAQYTGAPIDNLRDLAIDTDSKTLLLLTPRDVFEIAMPQ